uniref:Uncharacterized protein n=1 Tax=Meloidogyne incognita TaxID=6306 RepID=A0A914MPS1_MELIC
MDNKTEDNLKGAQINNSDKVEEQKNDTSFSSSSSTGSSSNKTKEGNNKKQKRKSDESGGDCSTILSSSCSAPVSSDESNGVIDGKGDSENNDIGDGTGGGEGTAGTACFNDSKAETEEDDYVLEGSGMSNNTHENVNGIGEGSGCNGNNDGVGGEHLQSSNLENGGAPCECVQCEVCMAENWWRMAAYQNTMLQQQEGGGSSEAGASPGFEITENPRAASAEGLGLIGSAAAMMLSQHSGVSAPTEEEVFRADFSMPKLREFFECQKQMGIPNFPEDFDEFWLLVVKARLFNIFKYRGPEAYNRIVLKIRDIALQFREQVEERERLEATAAISALSIQQNGGLAKQLPQKLQNSTNNEGGGKKKNKQRRKKGSSSGGSNNNYSINQRTSIMKNKNYH